MTFTFIWHFLHGVRLTVSVDPAPPPPPPPYSALSLILYEWVVGSEYAHVAPYFDNHEKGMENVF